MWRPVLDVKHTSLTLSQTDPWAQEGLVFSVDRREHMDFAARHPDGSRMDVCIPGPQIASTNQRLVRDSEEGSRCKAFGSVTVRITAGHRRIVRQPSPFRVGGLPVADAALGSYTEREVISVQLDRVAFTERHASDRRILRGGQVPSPSL